MHAYIVTGGTGDSRAKHITQLLTPDTELIHLQAEKTTITIKQIHDLITTLSITGPRPRLVWVEEAQQLTLPAQNALLKMLEEPPRATTFYLTCQTKSSLLPTIVSRAAHMQIEVTETSPSTSILSELKTIMSLSPGDRLVSIAKRDRNESIDWISEIELALRTKLSDPNLTTGNYSMLVKIARLAQDAHTQLAANCSVSLVTQNFLLSLPKTK